MTAGKTYHIEIWGCQMNVADAAAAARRLESLGYTEVPDPADADLVLLETCCVREKPEHKVYSRLGELRRFKEARPGMKLGVCGCMAEKEGRTILRHAPFVDLVIGPRRLARLPEILAELAESDEPLVETGVDGEPEPEDAQDFSRYTRAGVIKAFVNIIEGCNYRCAYCIVPAVRGAFSSRAPDAVADEVRRLVDAGVREVTLLGQSVLAYGRDRGKAFDIVTLFAQLQEIEGLARIRFTTNHPLEVTDRIIDAVAAMPKVMEHFHMPIQAGEDSLLTAMKRGYTVARYAELLGRIRARIPGVSVTSDVIVGFPGETDAIFETCLETYARLRFDQQFMFVYSPRPGTPAATRPDQVPPAVRVARMQRLVELQNAISTAITAAAAGQTFDVLVEGPSERDPARYAGRARNDKAMVFTAEQGPRRGELVRVVAEQGHLWGCSGRLAAR
ncbi:MAG TPA: tRNA (N6-isopentenyl adenosine(37)-C2)-methylthiotransferase MiaB [Armatimonadota bacterium]|nr:tRNA (N6-isopentenyl adenosine(37)-C2)-methylthiotransferase MiaB [Armatimonadota bacterium]